jgi:hypothetical protein
MKITTAELDCFYISFDEPQKEKHWASLLRIAPWAQRVDGVRGFDAAHKRCAELSSTDLLITIDGDNIVDDVFFNMEIELLDQYADCVLSWNSRNHINGLVYGNGGVKIWSKTFLQSMRSHENAVDESHAVDFCWDNKYIQLHNIYSTTYPNGSALQAFRAGFREGCKMTLDRGQVAPSPELAATKMYSLNLQRLLVWGSIGRDVENGKWAILGTRLGTHYTNVARGDIKLVRDYDAFGEFAEQFIALTDSEFEEQLRWVSTELVDNTGIEFFEFDGKQSKFFKQCMPKFYQAPNPITTEYEVLSNV